MADEDILTFEQLKDIQNNEQDEDTLGDLDEQFFDRVKDYLDRKQRIGGHLNNKEYRNAKHIVRDILDSRQKKIIRLAFLSTKSDIAVDNLLPEEEVLFDKVRESITEHREDIEDQLFGDEDGEETDESGDNTTDPTGDEADKDTEDQEPETDESKPDDAGDDDSDEDTEEDEDENDTETDEDDELLEAGDTDDDASEETTGTPSTDEKESTESDQDDDDGELLFGGGGDGDDEEDDEPDERTAGDLEEETDDDEGDERADNDDDDTEDDGKEMVEVRMTADVSEFMGVDLQSYGPFEEGETATIPDENAEVLQDQDKAEPVE